MRTIKSRVLAAAGIGFALTASMGAASQAAERVALVIGNDDYVNMSRLNNPAQDAAAIAKILRSNGFKVIEKLNVDRAGFLDALDELRTEARGADTALVFYAGHGGEVAGRDILAPKDLRYNCETKSLERAVRIADVSDAIAGAKRKALILDACRNEPFPQCPTRGGDAGSGFRGLSRIEGAGLIISSSTAPGAAAADGVPGGNSPFTGALISRLQKQNPDSLLKILLQVSKDLTEATKGAQSPVVELRGGDPEICLNAGACAEPQTGVDADRSRAEYLALKAEIERMQTEMKRQFAGIQAGQPAPLPPVAPFSPLPAKPSIQEVANRTKPSVVTVRVTGADPNNAKNDLPVRDLPVDSAFKEFFAEFKRNKSAEAAPSIKTDKPAAHPAKEGDKPSEPKKPAKSQGSGFFISSTGYIVTSTQMLKDVDKIEVDIDGGGTFNANVIGLDKRTEIALLKIDSAKQFRPLSFAKTNPNVGEQIFIISSPFGLGGTVGLGTVSALDRDLGTGPFNFMQLDATANRGSSGGPVLNAEGEVVGMVNAIYSPTQTSVNITFAIPADLVRDRVEKIRSYGRAESGWLGVNIQRVSEELAEGLGLREPRGALIAKVLNDGPAVGLLQAQDVILAADGKKVSDERDLARMVALSSPGTSVSLKVWREGKEENIRVKLGTFPEANPEVAKANETPAPVAVAVVPDANVGLTLVPAAEFPGSRLKEGLAIANVEPNSMAASKGLRRGEVVVEVRGKAVNSVNDFNTEIRTAREGPANYVLLQVRSRSAQRYLTLPLSK